MNDASSMLPAHYHNGVTLKMVHDRCVEEGECWIWKNALGQTGYPIIRARPHPCMLVRRVVAVLSGRAPAPRQPVVTTCGEKLCCNPEHLFPSTARRVGMAAARRGAFNGAGRIAKITHTKRSGPQAKLSMEIARSIRSSDKSSPVLAAEHGVHRSLILRIRQGTAWRDTAHPFFGLGARA